MHPRHRCECSYPILMASPITTSSDSGIKAGFASVVRNASGHSLMIIAWSRLPLRRARPFQDLRDDGVALLESPSERRTAFIVFGVEVGVMLD